MKKFIFITLIFFNFSCSNDENSNSIESERLVGTWFLQNTTINGEEISTHDIEIEFISSQRAFFTHYNLGSNGQDITENADYTINGNNIVFTWDDPEPGNETFTYEILELTSTTLKVKSYDAGDVVIEIYSK